MWINAIVKRLGIAAILVAVGTLHLAAQDLSGRGTVPRSAPKTSAPASLREIAGRWEAVSDDKTSAVIVELTTSGDAVTGTMTEIQRGYFSGRESITGQLRISGAYRNGTVNASIADAAGRGQGSASATIFRRGKYLVIFAGQREQGFARPGEQLVEAAEGSADAAALARAISGRVYSSSSQSAGRGAFVGGRTRLAVCADHRLEFDSSDLASTPGALRGQGVDFGTSASRRGTWSIVLLAGAPVLRAQWQGTGTSYSLTAYFVIHPAANGGSAVVDGLELPVGGSC